MHHLRCSTLAVLLPALLFASVVGASPIAGGVSRLEPVPVDSPATGEDSTTPRVAPNRIAFQGFLTDAGGAPLNGTVNLRLKLWTASVGGGEIWTEDQVGVSVSDGVFAVEVGAVNPLLTSFFDGSSRWLGVGVNGGAELSPRTALLTTPYAFHAVSADWAWTADHATTADVVSMELDDLTDVDAPAPTSGQVLQFDGVEWTAGTVATGSDGDWNISGSNLYSAVSGNVGIGVPSPTAKLNISAQNDEGIWVTNNGTGTNFTVRARNYNATGTTARFDSPHSTSSGYPSAPTALQVDASAADNAGHFSATDGVGVLTSTSGTGIALQAKVYGGAGVAGDFVGDVDISEDLTVSGTAIVTGAFGAGSALVTGNASVGGMTDTDSLRVDGGIYVLRNTISGGGDFYAGATNGVLNAGGGVLNELVNVIADTAPTLTFATGDEDLYIQDDLELGSQGYKPGGGSWATVSDVRLKKDIRDFEDGLDAVLKIRPIWYRYNERSAFDDGREYVGVSAQDMLDVAPFMVEEKPFGQLVREDASGREHVEKPGENYYSYDPSALVYMLVNAVQEQQKMLEEQRDRIAALEAAVGR